MVPRAGITLDRPAALPDMVLASRWTARTMKRCSPELRGRVRLRLEILKRHRWDRDMKERTTPHLQLRTVTLEILSIIYLPPHSTGMNPWWHRRVVFYFTLIRYGDCQHQESISME
mmetsp:Transcript_16182/g.32802  ORF Transcript_16182/g.32802 Transcript_16182/m.32802 type:complete len:116 (+) Transcript_16182:820-1167(+)